MLIDGVFGVAVPGHETPDFTSENHLLRALVLERESSKESFPHFLG